MPNERTPSPEDDADERERIKRWVERAERDAARLGIEDWARLATIIGRSPDERDAEIARLPDGDLGFLLVTLTTAGTTIAEGVRSEIVQTDPPGLRIVLTAEVLAGLGTVREVVEEEILRRIFRDER